jgi:hypothetical protein
MLTPAQFLVTGLEILGPSNFYAGQTVVVSVTVSNIGQQEGIYTVTLMLNGVASSATQQVNLAGGASTNIDIPITLASGGIYQISVAGQFFTPQIVQVFNSPPPPPGGTPTGPPPLTPKVITYDQASANIDVLVSVTGTASVMSGGPMPGTVIFIGAAPPSGLACPVDASVSLPAHLNGTTITVTGTIDQGQMGPELKITSASQITVQ